MQPSRRTCYQGCLNDKEKHMSKFKLTYFDFNGGRGEPIRIAFHAAGIDLEDHRIAFEEFMRTRGEMRFTCTPVLEVEGVRITQSNSILRYVGKMAGLYPDDDLQALYCDEAMDAVEDLLHQVAQTFGLEGDELRAARKKLSDSWISVYLRGLAEILQRGGGEYFAGNTLTVADLKVYVQIHSVLAGSLEHIPMDLVDKLAPSLVQHEERVGNDPIVTAYYKAIAS